MQKRNYEKGVGEVWALIADSKRRAKENRELSDAALERGDDAEADLYLSFAKTGEDKAAAMELAIRTIGRWAR
jgi:hypothetical protein